MLTVEANLESVSNWLLELNISVIAISHCDCKKVDYIGIRVQCSTLSRMILMYRNMYTNSCESSDKV